MRRLVGTVATTAVVAGTATAVGGAVRRRQQRKAQTKYEAHAYERGQIPQPVYAPPAAPAPAPAPAQGATDSLLDQLRQLGQLKADGILTDAEFDTQKTRLLNS